MKNQTIYLCLLFIVLITASLSSCTPKAKSHKEVIIAGEILHFESHKDIREFTIYYQEFFSMQEIKNIEINEVGRFKTTLDCHFKKDLIIQFQKAFAHLIICPGDSIYLTIDGDISKNPKDKYPNGSFFAKANISNRTDQTELVSVFINQLGKTVSSSQRREAMKRLPPLDYLKFRTDLEQKKINLLDSALQNTDDTLFEEWARDYIKYDKLDALLRYTWKHPRVNHISADSIIIPQVYMDNIFDKEINDTNILSQNHYTFLQDYFIYLYKQAKKKNTNKEEYISANSNGFSRDIVLLKYYNMLLKESDTLHPIHLDKINSSNLRNLFAENIELEQNKKTELALGKTQSAYIDSLFNTYKGKVVYVDFWSTNCGPCLKEMSSSKILQEQFSKQEVEFLFLCHKSPKDQWQKMIKKKELKGSQILLNDEQFSKFQTLFEVTGIPHYVLVNKKGGFINNAPRPSDIEASKKINELLNE